MFLSDSLGSLKRLGYIFMSPQNSGHFKHVLCNRLSFKIWMQGPVFCLSFPLALFLLEISVHRILGTNLCCVIFCSLKKIRPSSHAS